MNGTSLVPIERGHSKYMDQGFAHEDSRSSTPCIINRKKLARCEQGEEWPSEVEMVSN